MSVLIDLHTLGIKKQRMVSLSHLLTSALMNTTYVLGDHFAVESCFEELLYDTIQSSLT